MEESITKMLKFKLNLKLKQYKLFDSFRACLHGVGDPGLVGLVSFVLTPWAGGHKTKETYPTKPGSPIPCKQGLNAIVKLRYVYLLIIKDSRKHNWL